MNARPSFRPYLAATISLLVLGLGAWAAAVFALKPTILPRWLFFFGWNLALTGLAIPFTWFFNLRFPSDPPAEPAVIVRQAIWVGVYGATLLWLQTVRLVTIWMVLGLALGVIAIEYLIRMRERSRWKPAPPPEPPAPNSEARPPHA